MKPNRFSGTSHRTVALVSAVALAATLAPVALAAGLSSAKGEEAEVLESVRTVTLGGEDASYSALFDVRDGAPDCDRATSLTVGAHEFTCDDVTIETRSAEGVEDLPRFGVRAIRAKTFSDSPAPEMRAAETPRAPGLLAWSGTPVTGLDGVTHQVIVLGEEGTADDRVGADPADPAGSGGAAESADIDGVADSGSAEGARGLVAIVSGDAEDVDDATATILADVRKDEGR
ncbi:hypothetical protein [Corynebacterium xerosis]|uniref:Secreted protein n=1 Tax=Corynebacterium xerosis TaxID=1725 RepID=A0A7X9XSQ5_9CORY|nr:hypothetical protein [Corynebacterium xerosis]NMF08897.1 hypothetical protein [Corynebacterium xerosis]